MSITLLTQHNLLWEQSGGKLLLYNATNGNNSSLKSVDVAINSSILGTRFSQD